MRYLYIFVLVLFINGCSVPEPIDASDDLRFSKVLEKRYQLLEPLKLHANLVDDYKSKEILSYTISPGYKNRYVLWQKIIPVNTIIKVRKAFKYSNFLFSDYAYIVEIENSIFKLKDTLPIHIDSRLTKEKNEYIILDPKIFKIMGSKNRGQSPP